MYVTPSPATDTPDPNWGMDVTASPTIHVQPGDLTNDGTVKVEPGASLNDDGKVIDNGTIQIAPNAQIDDAGILEIDPNAQVEDAGSFKVDPNAQIEDAGSFKVDPNAQAEDGGIFQVDPNAQVEDGGGFQVDPNAQVEDGGGFQVDPNAQLYDLGTMSEGDSTTIQTNGRMLVTGNLTEGVGGNVNILGKLKLAPGATFAESGPVTVQSGGALDDSGSMTVKGGGLMTVNGSLGVPKIGSLDIFGTVILEPDSTYSALGTVTTEPGSSFTDLIPEITITWTSSSVFNSTAPNWTSTSQTPSLPALVTGDAITFTVTVHGIASGGGGPTGSVTLDVDSSPTSLPLTVGTTSSQATFTVPSLSASALNMLGTTHQISASYTSTDPNISSGSATVNLTVYTRNQGYVAQLYYDLLGRSVGADVSDGLKTWVPPIESGALSRAQVALEIQHDPLGEFAVAEVKAVYLKYLRRPADQAALDSWVPFLIHGGRDEALVAYIVGSPEYYDTQFDPQGGHNNTGFLSAVYRDVLSRPVRDPQTGLYVDQGGLGAWLPLLQQGSMTPSEVALSIIDGAGSTEYLQHLVMGFYQQYLRRPGTDLKGIDGWRKAMQGPSGMSGGTINGLTDAEVIAAILGDPTSNEYFKDL
jgi:hypothetical protein